MQIPAPRVPLSLSSIYKHLIPAKKNAIYIWIQYLLCIYTHTLLLLKCSSRAAPLSNIIVPGDRPRGITPEIPLIYSRAISGRNIPVSRERPCDWDIKCFNCSILYTPARACESFGVRIMRRTREKERERERERPSPPVSATNLRVWACGELFARVHINLFAGAEKERGERISEGSYTCPSRIRSVLFPRARGLPSLSPSSLFPRASWWCLCAGHDERRDSRPVRFRCPCQFLLLARSHPSSNLFDLSFLPSPSFSLSRLSPPRLIDSSSSLSLSLSLSRSSSSFFSCYTYPSHPFY